MQNQYEQIMKLTRESFPTFLIDFNAAVVHHINGSIDNLNVPKKSLFSFREFLHHIEKDNALAEIEGKKSFIKDMLLKIKKITTDGIVHLPLKSHQHTLWLTIKIIALEADIWIATIIHTSEELPKEIYYYQMTMQDPLTRLFTRETLKQHLENVSTLEGGYGMYLDIDGFKSINDTYGHKMGDAFLQAIANRFITQWEKDVIYYRLGGDEFFVYVKNHDQTMIKARAKRLIKTIEQLTVDSLTFDVSASIGIVKIHAQQYDYRTLLDLGDQAMYSAKALGRGNVVFASKQ